ncbi:FadR family transcriptional regulator [Leekyejoonella antrihumi]|uniref:FadR family transcriptional regulator n=1 Tax=Leekyejoonella antrihumi TaxID=1660198 RepID=A0A563E0M5_9MICO|nr:FadR family transcriptional regulator [Leekyejoonella antrihumi]
MLQPLRGRHVFEFCVEQLATSIRLGAYLPGSPLPPERELADRLGVSRATLREAIAALRMAGMVSTRRGRGGGTVVCFEPPKPGSDQGRRFDHAEILDALRFRRVVEPGAAALAARRDFDGVERDMLTGSLVAVTNAPNEAQHRQADSRLHLTVATLSGSPMLTAAVTQAQKYLHDMLISIPVLPRNIHHSNEQHAAIVHAVLTGDANRARQCMESHCDDTAALLRGLLG